MAAVPAAVIGQHRAVRTQIGGVVAGRRAVVEEEQRGAGDRDRGADQARGEAAERAGEGDDANEQRRRDWEWPCDAGRPGWR